MKLVVVTSSTEVTDLIQLWQTTSPRRYNKLHLHRGDLDKATLPFRWIFVVKSVMISWNYPNPHSSAIAINPYTWDRSHIEFGIGPFKI